AYPLAALLLRQIFPIFSVVAPCQRGASPASVRRRDFHHELLELLRTCGTDRQRLRIGVCRVVLVTGKIPKRSPDRLTHLPRNCICASACRVCSPSRRLFLRLSPPRSWQATPASALRRPRWSHTSGRTTSTTITSSGTPIRPITSRFIT